MINYESYSKCLGIRCEIKESCVHYHSNNLQDIIHPTFIGDRCPEIISKECIDALIELEKTTEKKYE